MTNLQSMDNLNYCYASAEAEKAVSTQESTASGTKCPHCGATIPEDCEICPACGRRIVSYCTFCGSPIEWSDSECPECGAPADGIRCPSCGTLSFRSFCPKCNTPVTKAAVRLLEAARKDPVFAEAQRLSEYIEENADKLGKVELIKVTADLNSLLDSMLPPVGSTPQEQRNYFCARKVAVTTSTIRRVRVGWVCNYCGCTHNQPSECCRPQLGGRWTYEDVTTTKTEYIKK